MYLILETLMSFVVIVMLIALVELTYKIVKVMRTYKSLINFDLNVYCRKANLPNCLKDVITYRIFGIKVYLVITYRKLNGMYEVDLDKLKEYLKNIDYKIVTLYRLNSESNFGYSCDGVCEKENNKYPHKELRIYNCSTGNYINLSILNQYYPDVDPLDIEMFN